MGRGRKAREGQSRVLRGRRAGLEGAVGLELEQAFLQNPPAQGPVGTAAPRAGGVVTPQHPGWKQKALSSVFKVKGS